MGKYIHGFHHRVARTQGKDCIFVVVDRLTKFAHFFPYPQTLVQHRWLNYFSERCSDYNSCQNVLMNLLSLSLMMVLGRPCSLNTSLKNNSATCVALKSVAMGKKCENFVNLSTTMKIQSFPYALGNPVMKSMDMLSHLCSRIGKG